MSTLGTPTNTPTLAVVGGQAGRNNVDQIESDLQRIFGQSQKPRVILDQLIQSAVRHTQSEFVALYQPDSTGKMRTVASHGNLDTFQELFSAEAFHAVCQAAATRKDVITKCLSESARRFAIAAPVMAPGQPASVFTALVTPGEHGVAPRIAAIDMIAGALSQWRLTDALDRLEWEARASAAATELVSRIETSESFPAALFLTVNELQKFFACEQVILGQKRLDGAGVDVKVVSGVAEFDKNAESMELVRAAMDETLVRAEMTTWPPLSAKERHATLAHRKLIETTKHEAVVSVPLTTIEDQTLGTLMFLGRRDGMHNARRLGAIEAMRPHLATAIATRKAAEPSKLRKAWRMVFGNETTVTNKALVAAVAIPLCIIPMIPVPHRIKSDCIVEPVVRRFTVAPYDGLLKNSLVKPGDIVQEGQVLARMDDRELRWEMSRLAADRARALKKVDVAMASHDTSEQQLAEFERQAFDVKIKLLKYREENLEITAPLDGLILKGDLEDAQGAPVQAGQALFEVAPLDPIKLELAIPEEDLPTVSEGMTVTAQLDGYRGDKVSGEVSTIHPRAEIRDGQNVFIAEVQLENPDGELLPGMSGLARVRSNLRPLGWIWFHKAWHRVRVFFGV
jgi:biotin carboxyl carrier protein